MLPKIRGFYILIYALNKSVIYIRSWKIKYISLKTYYQLMLQLLQKRKVENKDGLQCFFK